MSDQTNEPGPDPLDALAARASADPFFRTRPANHVGGARCAKGVSPRSSVAARADEWTELFWVCLPRCRWSAR
jgi:hypothetical protein